MVKNGNLTLLLTSSGQKWQLHLLMSSGKELQFNIATTSSGQEWQFHIATDV